MNRKQNGQIGERRPWHGSSQWLKSGENTNRTSFHTIYPSVESDRQGAKIMPWETMRPQWESRKRFYCCILYLRMNMRNHKSLQTPYACCTRGEVTREGFARTCITHEQVLNQSL
uniref:Uncharacterized protein n=1 Tax=Steinernema glaseri TaxID=37863 RepID=A0A1I8A7Z5_9BILA